MNAARIVLVSSVTLLACDEDPTAGAGERGDRAEANRDWSAATP